MNENRCPRGPDEHGEWPCNPVGVVGGTATCSECGYTAAYLAPRWAAGMGSAAIRDIQVERNLQEAEWGEQNHDDAVWSLILSEEVGEAAQASLRKRFGGGKDKRLREELVQVAAVAVAWIEAIDRRMAAPVDTSAIRTADHFHGGDTRA